MNATSAIDVITGAVTDLGAGVLSILGVTIAVAVGMFLFYWGFRKAKSAFSAKS